MIEVRRSEERGGFDHGWLDTRHTFSFGDYHDPEHMGFRVLRVLNEDVVAPGGGFPLHGHRDMEILTFVLSGALRHEDSLGNGSVIRPGDVQRMSAGTGIRHAEINASRSEPVHLLQVWILPDRAGHLPSYAQHAFPAEERADRLRLVASPDGADGSVDLHQDARVLVGTLAPGVRVTHRLAPGRHAWLQVARGSVRLGPETLRAGDGAAVSDESAVEIEAGGGPAAEVLLFDLP